MAVSYCLDPTQVADFANKDVNRIIGKVAEVLARKSPFMDVLDGGTLPNVSDVVRSVVQERAVVGTSLVAPVFVNDIAMCNGPVGQDQVGSTEYTFQLQSYRGQGPLVCVKQARTAFKTSYLQAQVSLEKGVLSIMNSDIRSQLNVGSGVKYVVNSTVGVGVTLTGDMQQVNTNYYPLLPDSPLTFALLFRLAQFEREEMLADPFDVAGVQVAKFIGSFEIIERFRQELAVKDDIHYLAAGSYRLGEKSIIGYQFEGPYRGLALANDNQPLRYANLLSNGQPNFIEPVIGVPTTRGVGERRNPAWVNAPYEIGFLIMPDSFKRLVPETYTGEGTFKWAPQLSMGELQWHYIKDTCNKFGDFGQHIYQISRAYQPIRPQNVMPIAYLRCSSTYGITPCSQVSSGSGL